MEHAHQDISYRGSASKYYSDDEEEKTIINFTISRFSEEFSQSHVTHQ